ncbi:MAG: FAD-binding protein [Anaerolineales bacterium]|nr:FAD-binding protein [Anaerolineales bacterium]
MTSQLKGKLSAFGQELSSQIQGDVRFDPLTTLLYSTDASNYQIEPLGVVFPRHVDELQAIVELAWKYDIPVLPRGAGTSLAGQSIGPAVIIDCFKHLRAIRAIDPEQQEALVEPGVVLDRLNQAAAVHGLQYGPDPATSNRATMGGIVANNASGSHSIRFGMSVDHTVSTEVVLSDGTLTAFEMLSPAQFKQRLEFSGLEGQIYRGVAQVLETYPEDVRRDWPETWRRASGYNLNYLLDHLPSSPGGWYAPERPYSPAKGLNLSALICGSEGTLAVIRQMRLRLVPRQRYHALVVLEFDEIAAACDETARLLETSPSAIELIPRSILAGARTIPEYSRKLDFVSGNPEALLVVEYSGDSREEVEANSIKPGRGLILTDEQAQADLWAVRKAGLGLLMSIQGDTKPITFIEDAAVPVDRLGAYVRKVNEILKENGTVGEWYAHASAGCLHMRPMINLRKKEDVARMRTIADAVVDVIIDMKGSVSGEHGDGIARSEFNERLFGTRITQAFRDIKTAFDPKNLMNPGKIISIDGNPPRMHEQLRLGGTYQTIALETIFQYPEEGDFAHVVENCSGVGECLKEGGVMCPSFQATRDERNSTRGRANVLRAVISGRIPQSQLFSKEIYGVLDLCLACKGCKSECPTAVDIARVKSEYLHMYQQQHGVPLRSYIFAEYDALARLAKPFSFLINPIMATRAARWALEKAVGVSRHRKLPAFAFDSFYRWFKRHHPLHSTRRVILFVDTYIESNQPEVGFAAVRVLEKAGYRVELAPGQVCCGRTMISKGLLDRARRHAEQNLVALAPFAAEGIPIIGVEPSCLATLRDEYLQFFPEDPRARDIAKVAVLIEEFLTAEDANGTRPVDRLDFQPSTGQILLHGHCHAKALVGTSPTAEMLKATGMDVGEIESGCCGMAGSFGYEKEHYQLSMDIGELHLFPAIRRGMESGSLIAAAGISCRTQIYDGTGCMALHPIQIIDQYLAVNDGN